MNANPGAEWYLQQALAQIPRVLTLCDRDPSSPTYGCFDRNYWHYRTQDFPSGMYQELTLALAHAVTCDHPSNPWYNAPRLRELAIAGVRQAARAAHRDGSCDDYFPYERALGATAFVAAASARVLELLDERPPDLLAFLRRSTDWLLAHQETGRLTNHQALVALAAARVAHLTGEPARREAARQRLEVCLAWQHAEGWFAEYEGADPAYQTLTLAFLAALRDYLPDPRLDDALRRGVEFAAHFLHPDGSFAGETGSRNNHQVLPSGFERLADTVPAAAYLADGWIAGAQAGQRGYPDDDRIVCHWLQDFFEAARIRRHRSTASPPWRPPAGRVSFSAARLHVIREAPLHLVISTSKGGVVRAYCGTRLLCNDTGLVGLDASGRRYVTHILDPTIEEEWGANHVVIRGRFHRAARKLATPWKQVLFRCVNATLGRCAPNLLRALLQKILITGKRPTDRVFERRIEWTPAGQLRVTDRLGAGVPFVRLWATTDATSIYVATSNLWQTAAGQPWEDVTEAGARGVIERTWPA